MDVLLSILKTTIMGIDLSTVDLITLFKTKTYDNCTQMKIIAFIFEIICALEKFETLGQEVQLYAHINMEVKDKKGFPTEDTGIDLMSKDMTYYGQVKNYKTGTYVQAEHIKQSALNFYHGLYKDPENPPKVLEFLTPDGVKLSYGKLKFDFIQHNFISMDIVEKWIKIADAYQLPPPPKQKDFKLRRCQKEALAVIKEKYNKKENVYIEIVCGGGKSDMMCYFLKHIKPDAKVLILVPLLILLEQWSDTLTRWHLPHSLCGTGYNVDVSERIVVCVYKSFEKTTKGKYEYFIVDESHHMERKEVREEVKEVNSDEESDDEEVIEEVEELFIAKEDKKDIKYINKIIETMKTTPSICLSATMRTNPDYRYTIEDGIKDGVITDYQTIVAVFSTSNYTNSLIDYIANNPKFNKKLVYTNSIESCKKFTKAMNDKGMKASFITREVKKEARRKILEDFRSGKIGTIVSVNTLGEGVNIPEADTCIFSEPRSSHFSIIQASMRVMRSHPSKGIAYLVIPVSKNNEVKESSKFIKAFVNRDNRLRNIITGGVVSHRLVVKAADEDVKVDEAEFIWEKVYNSTSEREDFMRGYIPTEKYFLIHKKFPTRKKEQDGVKIGIWFRDKRTKLRKGLLSEHHLKLLNDLSPTWMVTNAVEKIPFKKASEHLKEFRLTKGYFPKEDDTINGYRIGIWFTDQRRVFKRGEMKPENIKILDDIDITWRVFRLSYKEKVVILKKYYDENENEFPECREEYEGIKLGNWYYSQKKLFRSGNMDETRIRLLDEIDVKWKIREMTFEEKVEYFRKYYLITGKIPKWDTEYEGVKIGALLTKQRYKFKEGTINKDTLKLLDSVTPKWREDLEQISETV
jgi:superfamily II DNA or RNA helicase